MSVSILIPVHNRQKYITDCLISIAQQDFKDYTIIIYDDGSTDGTINSILETGVPHKLIRGEKNMGVGYARQQLIDAFETDYACWLDSDDSLHPQRLAKQYKHIKDNELDVCYTGIINFNQDLNNIVQYIDADISRYTDNLRTFRANTTCATAMFSKKIKDIKFNLELKTGEDVDWLYRMFLARFKIGYLKEYLYYYRQENQDRLTVLRHKGLLGDLNYGK